MPCVLRYWDPTQKCYITYKDFNLSENNATSIPLPDPSIAHPSEVIVAAEWQMVVDVTVDIDYPDDGRLVTSHCQTRTQSLLLLFERRARHQGNDKLILLFLFPSHHPLRT